jgi:hypothetical protein
LGKKFFENSLKKFLEKIFLKKFFEKKNFFFLIAVEFNSSAGWMVDVGLSWFSGLD